MDFLEKITSISKNAVDKTGDFIEINGLKNKISIEETKIREGKEKLGDYYWKKFNAGAELEEEAVKLCREIEDSVDVIDGYNRNIEKIKSAQVKSTADMLTCPVCGAPVAEGVKFCSECGAKID